jgi:hypothetical protein
MKRIRLMLLPSLMSALICAMAGCSDGPSDSLSDTPLDAPTNLRACSDTNSVLLAWNVSANEYQSNFSHYQLTVRNKANDSAFTRTVVKGTSSYRAAGLKNGTRYAFVLHAVSTKGKASVDSAVVEWSPALRHAADADDLPIRVYANTSTFPSGLDLNNDKGKAELLQELSTAFSQRADLLVTATNIVSPLVIQSPHKSLVNPGPITEFSTVPAIDANSLNETYATSSPSTSTYTAYEITVAESPTQKGKIYFGRVKRGNDRYYFRLLLKRSTAGSLVHGVSIDRYLEMDISYQDVRQVPFAKR